MNLTPAAQKFVLHWGEMGQAAGINRTMAQVHALLFVLAPTPLDAEEISRLLGREPVERVDESSRADHLGVVRRCTSSATDATGSRRSRT